MNTVKKVPNGAGQHSGPHGVDKLTKRLREKHLLIPNRLRKKSLQNYCNKEILEQGSYVKYHSSRSRKKNFFEHYFLSCACELLIKPLVLLKFSLVHFVKKYCCLFLTGLNSSAINY